MDDLHQTVSEIINQLCSKVFTSIDEKVFPLLDELVFIDKNIFDIGDRMNKLLSTSPTNGVLLLANCLFTAFVLYYVARLMISNLIGNNSEPPGKFFIRAFLAGVTMNYSLPICKFLITSTNYISSFFCNLGENVFDKEISFVSLTSVLSNISVTNFNVLSIEGILSGMLSISSFALIINFAYRYILVKVLIILSPFAILCLTTNYTEGFFKSWFKCLLSLLIIQIVVSVILLIPYALIRESSYSVFNQILLVGSIMSLIKSNQFVKEFMGGVGIGSNFQAGIAGIRSIFTK